ncbi:MAG: LysR family transcriptional regulator [Bdellovibrionaceae bacterium]|nr:LysR family transcriptional regulator [Pseudobdellovibrionaceae bacterium]
MKFVIPPEYGLIVNAFNQTSSLRGAAQLLGIDPAALVRKVQMISQEFGYLEKIGRRWTVTDAGKKIAYWTEEMINSQKLLAEETPRLRISAYAWLTEEALIPNFASLDAAFKVKYKWSLKMGGMDLESDLIHNRTDFVIHGKAPNDPSIAHRRITNYPWVAIAPYAWKEEVSRLAQKPLIQFLNTRKFCRHADLNPVTVLNYSPDNIHDLIVDGVIGLRSSVINEMGWSAVPAMSIQSALKEKKIIKLNLPITYSDNVSLWWIRSRKDVSSYAKHIAYWIQKIKVS